MDEQKQCKGCGVTKPLTDFSPASPLRGRKPKCKACMSAYEKVNRAKHSEARAKRASVWRQLNRPKNMVSHARHRARQQGLDFNIDTSDIVIPALCPVFGIPMTVIGARTPYTATLDRIDNSRGYVKGNVAVISWKANELKRDGSIPELKAILAYMESHLSAKPAEPQCEPS